jgi:hypothetical protein
MPRDTWRKARETYRGKLAGFLEVESASQPSLKTTVRLKNYKKNQSRKPPKSTVLTKCPYCRCTIRQDNLLAHYRKLHRDSVRLPHYDA